MRAEGAPHMHDTASPADSRRESLRTEDGFRTIAFLREPNVTFFMCHSSSVKSPEHRSPAEKPCRYKENGETCRSLPIRSP